MLFLKKKYSHPDLPPEGLVNLHCHILAGVDDGARDDGQMYELIRLEYNCGVRRLCFTPHYNPAIFTPRPAKIYESYEKAQKFVSENFADMSVCLGNEVFMHADTLERLRDGSCRPLGDSRTVLIEFSPSVSFDEMRLFSVKLLSDGWTPLLAHIERYNRLCEPEQISELKDLGVKFQINTEALGGSRKKFVSKLIGRGIIDVIADDRHSMMRGEPDMGAAYAYVEQKFGMLAARALFMFRPLSILNTIEK